MKLWQKEYQLEKLIENFTVGNDRNLDIHLAPFDVLGSLAHIQMLESIGLLEKNELEILQNELRQIYSQIQDQKFEIEEGVEDVHSQIELLLTKNLGEIGKKIHSGRSRNDQVLLDLKLYMRHSIKNITVLVHQLFKNFISLSEKHKNKLMAGYTHTQIAMPSSFGLWFGAYAESLTDDLVLLQAAHKIINQNPLGSAAGYGSSFPLNRQLTTDLLGFEKLNYNVVYAQMGRGKAEKSLGFAISSIAATLGKMSADICLFMSQNLNFLTFPDEFTTGSSIMPHKKNPDVFEIMRGKCNRLQNVPQEIGMILNNLTVGYHRDLQLVKEIIVPAILSLTECLEVFIYTIPNIVVREDILKNPLYEHLFSVESVNEEVMKGTSFRDAYRKIGKQISEGSYHFDGQLAHTHEGSIGNLCNEHIEAYMEKIYTDFNFSSSEKMYDLLKNY